jgi:hypothetical protein
LTLDHYTCAFSNFDFILTMGLGSSLTFVVACGSQGVGCGSRNVSHQSATRAGHSRRFLLPYKLQDYKLKDINMKEGEGGEGGGSACPSMPHIVPVC